MLELNITTFFSGGGGRRQGSGPAAWSRQRAGAAAAVAGGGGGRQRVHERGWGTGGLGLDWVDPMDVDCCTNLKQWKVGEKKIFRKIYRIGGGRGTKL